MIINLLLTLSFATRVVGATFYIEQAVNTLCATELLTEQQCTDYATEKGLGSVTLSTYSHIPPGCSVSGSLVVFWNTDLTSVGKHGSHYPVCSTESVGGGGDPHFFGFGQVFFSWQGICDTILIKTPKVGGVEPNIEIHIRTRRVRHWSAIDAIAIKVGHYVAQIGSNDGRLILDKNFILNGSEVDSFQTDMFSVTKSFFGLQKSIILYEFVFGKEKKLEIKVNTKAKMIYTTMSGNFPQGTDGLLGSPHNPGRFARDGTNMTGFDVNVFAETWQVRDSDNQLFQERRIPQFPMKCLYYVSESGSKIHSRRLKEVNKISLEEATVACAAHTPGEKRKFCVEDAIATGDLDSAKDPFYG